MEIDDHEARLDLAMHYKYHTTAIEVSRRCKGHVSGVSLSLYVWSMYQECLCPFMDGACIKSVSVPVWMGHVLGVSLSLYGYASGMSLSL